MNFILKINIVSVVIISAQYLSCSLHQTTNLVFPNFFSVLAVVKEEKKYWSETFGSMKSLFSVSTAQTEKIFLEIIGVNKIGSLVIWCHKHDAHRIQQSISKIEILFFNHSECF